MSASPTAWILACLTLSFAQSTFADSLDHWTVRPSGTGKNLYGTAYGSGRFVIVGQSGAILVSTNGALWNAISNSSTATLYSAAWGSNTFVAVGDNGTILTSVDGQSWTAQTSPVTNNLKSVRFFDDAFLAVGANGTLISSSNGFNWQTRNSGSTMTLQGVARGNSVFCAIGGGNTQDASVTRSIDSLSWSNQTLGINYLYDITFGNGVFVVQGIRGIAWVSPNGLNWLQRPTTDTTYLYGETFAQGFFVAVGDLGLTGQKIVTSTDGTNWIRRPVTTILSSGLHGVTYGNGYFIAVGEKGAILQSDPVFRLTSGPTTPAGARQWILTGEAGRVYRLQYSENPGSSNWVDVTNFTSTDEVSVLLDPTADAVSARFYRAVSP